MASSSPISPVPPDWDAPELKVTRPAPDWFGDALAHPFESCFVEVEGCPIHYLRWEPPTGTTPERGLLLVHGGGAHAQWWRFIAPQLTDRYRVAALDLSGMGDSGHREVYSAAQRALEMRTVIDAAGLGPQPWLVAHSFGGYMTMRFGVDYGDDIHGAVIVDSPIRRPDDPESQTPRRALSVVRHYPGFEIGVERFRLMPPQACVNDYLVEFIARHSLREVEAGFTWKFDVAALGPRRWDEPFPEHFRNMRCPLALMYGEQSALVNRSTIDYMVEIRERETPVVPIPDAHHHVMLDQPLEFTRLLRELLAGWQPR